MLRDCRLEKLKNYHVKISERIEIKVALLKGGEIGITRKKLSFR